MDLPLGLLLLHPVEEGEEEVGVGRRDRPLRPTMIQGRFCIFPSHLIGDKLYGRQKKGLLHYTKYFLGQKEGCMMTHGSVTIVLRFPRRKLRRFPPQQVEAHGLPIPQQLPANAN